MLHGWGMNSRCWGAFAEHLSRSFTLHLVDLPGHGTAARSGQGWDSADRVSRLLERLPGAAWLGWSLGGRIALDAALQQPTALSHLILISTNPCFIANRQWGCGMDPQVFAAFASAVERDPVGALERFNGLQVAGSSNARATLKALRETSAAAAPAAAALVTGLQLLGDPGLLTRLHDIRVPTLWIGGSQDRLVPLEAMRRSSSLIPGSAFAAIEGAGHAAFISHAAEMQELVSGFLRMEQAA